MLLPFIRKVIDKIWKITSVSLIQICGKVFERLTYNSLLEFYIKDELIAFNQSGFKPVLV